MMTPDLLIQYNNYDGIMGKKILEDLKLFSGFKDAIQPFEYIKECRSAI